MPPPPSARSEACHPIYIVFGPETFLRGEAVRAVCDRVLGDADRVLALSEYDGSSTGTELAQVLDDLRTLPFLTERRLVAVRDADSFISRYREQIEVYLDKPSPTGVLLLDCRSCPGNTKIHKKAAKIGEVIECKAFKGRQVAGWVADRAKSVHGLQIDARATALLCDLIGDDLGVLDAELQKIALYAGSRKRITVDDIHALVGQHREEEVWGILSALAAGDQARAMTLWEEVWQTDRAASARAVAGIAFKVRQLLAAKRAEKGGATMSEIAHSLWRSNDARLRAELAAFSIERIEEMLCRLLEADVAAKTGGVSVRSSIEAFIVDMCRGRQRARATV